MRALLAPWQQEKYSEFTAFVQREVEPYANQWDIEQRLSPDIIRQCAERGYFGGTLPASYDGHGWDYVTYGLFNEAIGRGSVSLSGLFNVHTMVAESILKWGTEEQKAAWLSRLASGQAIAALALTEPGAGSDLQMMGTEFRLEGDHFIVNGRKKWITFGGLADVLLVFGKLSGTQPVACLVERNRPGLTIHPIRDMLGFKASQLATIELDECRIPSGNMLGRPGFALSHIAPYALEYGRISIAWAALGLLRGCLETCGEQAMDRHSFGMPLIDHGMISHMIADMGVDLEAAEHLCLHACQAKDEHSAEATEKIMIAKYFASRAGARHSANAVQIMGASGCNDQLSVSRYYRDSKTMEIVEGSNQIHQLLLGKGFAQRAKHLARRQARTSEEQLI